MVDVNILERDESDRVDAYISDVKNAMMLVENAKIQRARAVWKLMRSARLNRVKIGELAKKLSMSRQNMYILYKEYEKHLDGSIDAEYMYKDINSLVQEAIDAKKRLDESVKNYRDTLERLMRVVHEDGVSVRSVSRAIGVSFVTLYRNRRKDE
jgi:hypothetical protein